MTALGSDMTEGWAETEAGLRPQSIGWGRRWCLWSGQGEPGGRIEERG